MTDELGNSRKLARAEKQGARSGSTQRAAALDRPSGRAAMEAALGRRALGAIADARALQPKLTVSDPGDVYEEEAERVADQVMRMPDPMVEAAGEPSIQRVCMTGEELQRPQLAPSVLRSAPEEEELLQTKSEGASDEVTPQIETAVQGLPGRGEPLPETLRAFMEPRFKADFGAVRVHTDAHAQSLARAVDAQAFTVGRDIVFSADRYAPETSSGRKLLAHELTHVVQQGGASVDVARIQRTDGTPGPAPLTPVARRRIVIDADVLSQINRGNQPAAVKLKDLAQTAEVSISQEAYNAAVVNRTRKDMGMANKRLLEELNIKVGPPESIARGTFAQRVEVYDKNIVGPKRAVLSEQLKGQPNLVGGDVFTAAQAKAADAEVWSFDRAYRNNATGVTETLGVKVAPECQTIAPMASPQAEDWRIGRRLLGLQEIEILPDGTIVAPRASTGGAATSAVEAEPKLAIPKALEPPARAPTVASSVPEVTIEPPKSARVPVPRAAPGPVVNPDALHPVMRVLRDLAKIIFSPVVLVPVAVLLEALNAVQMYAMAMGGLSGAGFVFREHIAQLRSVLDKVGTALTQCRRFNDQLEQASTVAYVHALAGKSGPSEELFSLVFGMEPELRDLLTHWTDVRRQAVELQLAADRQRKLGEALLASREFHQLTAPMGTVAAATVLGATTDMTTIRGLAGECVKVLDPLILVLGQDLEMAAGIMGMRSVER